MLLGRPFWVAFTAFFLLGAAWALALPVNGTYDESAHIARAYAVYSGQWRTGEAELRVPASLLPSNPDCTWAPRPATTPASCQQWNGGKELVAAPSGASRYPPLYYGLVGAPIRLMPDSTGVVASRLLSAAAGALLLAAAVAVATALGPAMLVAATALVVTPTVANLMGAVNPNGMEIAAAILLFVALLGLFGVGAEPSATFGTRKTLLVLTGIAAFLLLTLRHLGPLLLGVDLIAVALVVGRHRAAAQTRDRSTRLLVGGPVAAGALLAGVWLLVGGSPAEDVPQGRPLQLSAAQVVDGLATSRVPFYVEQVVGRFSYGETRISPWAILLWYSLVIAAVVVALRRGARRTTLVVAGLVVVSLAILIALELVFLPRGRWYAHGRYVLPVLVGAVLVAGWAAPRVKGYVPTALVVATAPVHLYALTRVMARFQSGGSAGVTSVGDGPWRSPSGTIAPLACALVAVALLVATILNRRTSP